MHRMCLGCFVFVLVFGSLHWQTAQAQPPDDAAEVQDRAEQPEESPLLIEPKTSEEYFDAAVLMVDLARPKLARLYLQRVMTPAPNEELLLRLRDKHGPAIFLKLANIRELHPLSSRLLDLVNDAFRKQGADENRIDALLADLRGTTQQRAVALIALRNARAVVVPRILHQIGATREAEHRELLLITLTRLGQQIVPPLLGALDSPNADMQAVAIEALGCLKAHEAVPYLWCPAFAPKQPVQIRTAARQSLARILSTSSKKVERVSSYGVAQELHRIALSHYRNDYNWKLQVDGTVALWLWHPEAETVGISAVNPETASLYVGTRFARQAAVLAPDHHDLQSLYVGFVLATDWSKSGWEAPLPTGPGTAHDLALTVGSGVVLQTLAQALEFGRTDTALAALQVLGQTATRHQLGMIGHKSSPIIAALNYDDARVQFAAASTVLQLDPAQTFRGNDRVVAILQRALNDNGSPAALVVHAKTENARVIGDFLDQIGIKPFTASTGKDAFRLAAKRTDIKLIVLDINIVRWGLSQTIANLRADARTAGIPILIYGSESMRVDVAGLLSRHSMMSYVVTSATADGFKTQVELFLNSFRSPVLTPKQRATQRETAAYWFAHIVSSRRNKVFDISPAEKDLFKALNEPALTGNALLAISGIASQQVQSQLSELVVNSNRDVEFRESAAVQLAFHIQRFGLLLGDREVLDIMTSWNEASDPALSTALASVVGSLKPNTKRVSNRLSKFPVLLPPLP